MNTILTRITLVGGLYLAILSLIPQIMISGIQLQHLPLIGNWIDTTFPRFLLDGLERPVLFRRHLAADRGGRGHGHHQPDRGAADHAPLRRVYAASGTSPRAPQLVLDGRGKCRNDFDGRCRAFRNSGETDGDDSVRSARVRERDAVEVPGRNGCAFRRSRPETCSGSISAARMSSGARSRTGCGRDRWFPDELVNRLVYERISQPDCERGFILDGYPRTPAQAEDMMRLLAARGRARW